VLYHTSIPPYGLRVRLVGLDFLAFGSNWALNPSSLVKPKSSK